MMAYERCTTRKLRSLFEYLDTDKDGRITPQNLLSGISKLQTEGFKDAQEGEFRSRPVPISCEYEIEELLRCIPK